MGRVARYKKTKSFDKEHRGGEYVWGSMSSTKKKKRSLTAERHYKKKSKRKGFIEDGGFDLPPGKDDFDLADLVVKKQKKRKLDHDLNMPSSQIETAGNSQPSTKVTSERVKIGNKIVPCAIPQNDQEERRMVRSLNIDKRTGKSSTDLRKESSIEGRRKGESMNAFNRRLKEETDMALANDHKNKRAQDVTDDREQISKSQRRKEFLKKKKKKQTSDSQDGFRSFSKDWTDEGLMVSEQVVTRPSFLEQAEQPPTFKQLPRGAKAKVVVKKDPDGKSLDEVKIKAEQNAMEVMRRKVQAQYAKIKAKRREEGKFHL